MSRKRLKEQENAQNAKLKSCISKTRGLSEADAIEVAEKQIKHMEMSYKGWLRDQFDTLKATFAKEDFDPEKDLKTFYDQTHDIKSLGSTFGYFLITDVTQCLGDLLEHAINHNNYPKDAVNIHMQALELVIIKNAKGEPTEASEKLLKGLQNVFAKVVKDTKKLTVPAH